MSKYQTSERKGRRQHVFKTFASSAFIQAIERQRSDCQFRNSRSTFFARIKHVHITSYYNMVSSLSNHVCSCPVMFNFESQWSGPTPALPLSRIGSWELWAFQVHCWPHRDKSRLTTHPKQLNIYIRHVFSVSYHADTRLTWSFMKADINIQWQRSELQNSPSSGCQSQALLQVATLGIHTSLLSWTAAAGTSENAHKHGPALYLSLVNQCAKIKLGSWVQPTALVHFELKLSLYVCQPKLDMQCIEILSRAMPRLLAVSNAMLPNRNMPAYLQNGKYFLSSWIETIPYR